MGVLGGHTSVAGGIWKAFARAEEDGFDAMQIFLKNQNRWQARDYTDEEVEKYHAEARRSPVKHVIAHDSYLINLATPKDELWEKSIAAFADELDRAEQLGVSGVVMHPGSHVKTGEEAGLKRVIQAFNRILSERPDNPTLVLLETTAGQGTNLGWRFEHLRDIVAGVDEPQRFGVCVDTCHIFAAGYDIRTEEGYNDTFAEFDRIVGIDRIKAFHVNDSLKEFASRKDRHENIGKGFIGDEAFRCLVNDPRFAEIPMVLETDPADDMHRINVEHLRSLSRT